MTESAESPETAAAVLVAVRSESATADRAEARKLELAVEWAGMHSVDSIDQAATMGDHSYGDTGITVAGPGAPLVAEFSVAEFAAAVGLPTEAGKAYLGEAVELRHRLPRLWARVVGGDLPAWRARRIARATILLSRKAATYVDHHVAHVAHKIRNSQLDRLLDEAIARFMPAEAERRRRHAAEGRCFNIDKRQAGLDGTTDVWGSLDTADALDLDAAVAAGAETLKALGNTDPLDVRRATALGHLARQQLALDLDASTGERSRMAGRNIVLYVHLSDAAIRNGGLGRVENTQSPVSSEQIRDWCGTPDTHITVKPVIDLPDHVHVDAYEIPERLHEAAALVDHTCVFPWCTRPARRCDCDHITPYNRDGPTCSCNLAPLCRRHHRLKTHGNWTYTQPERGTYLWTSPHGYPYLRDHHGTLDLTPHAHHQARRA